MSGEAPVSDGPSIGSIPDSDRPIGSIPNADRPIGSIPNADRPIGSIPNADRPIGSIPNADRPIGVFDSGIGGLSILNALRGQMPRERFVYYADAAYAPYGERGEGFVVERSLAIAGQLVQTHGVKALVVACNTATAAAIRALRDTYEQVPVVGVEPALKPAVAISRTHRIAVLATRGTLASAKYQSLLASLGEKTTFSPVACDGLAAAIEHADATEIVALCARYISAAGNFGTEPGQIDTLVLGCTHYPFVADELRRCTGAAVRFVDTCMPVAQQTRRVIEAIELLAVDGVGGVELLGTGDLSTLRAAAARWLQPVAGAERRI